jgi:putative redox protein
MKSTLTWKDGMLFEAQSTTNTILMDAKAPIGKEQGLTPKELIAAGLGGCTAMDVMALMKKHKQTVTDFKIDVDVEPTSGKHPHVFAKAEITFALKGQIDPAIALESVRLSQTKFCGVSAMLAKAFPITYKVLVNDENVGTGQTHFEDTL